MIKRLISTRALRQGLLGGSPFWRVVWIAQFVYKRFGGGSKGDEAPISFDEPLKEGEVWALVHEPAKTKKGRGEGRRFLIGPRRKKSRTNMMTGLALGVVGEKILAAPSAERINQILGEDVFDPPEPTRAQKRALKKARKLEAKAAKSASKAAKADASTAKRQRAAELKLAKREEKSAMQAAAAAATAAKKLAAANRAAAKKAARAEAKSAARAAKIARRDARVSNKSRRRARNETKPAMTTAVIEAISEAELD